MSSHLTSSLKLSSLSDLQTCRRLSRPSSGSLSFDVGLQHDTTLTAFRRSGSTRIFVHAVVLDSDPSPAAHLTGVHLKVSLSTFVVSSHIFCSSQEMRLLLDVDVGVVFGPQYVFLQSYLALAMALVLVALSFVSSQLCVLCGTLLMFSFFEQPSLCIGSSCGQRSPPVENSTAWTAQAGSIKRAAQPRRMGARQRSPPAPPGAERSDTSTTPPAGQRNSGKRTRWTPQWSRRSAGEAGCSMLDLPGAEASSDSESVLPLNQSRQRREFFFNVETRMSTRRCEGAVRGQELSKRHCGYELADRSTRPLL